MTDKLAFTVSPEEYLSDTLTIADNFTEAASILLNTNSFNVLDAAGYLASHATELYLKAFIIAHTGSRIVFKEITSRENGHNFKKLLEIASRYDPEILKYKSMIDKLDKYSGTKLRYADFSYNNNAPKVYGSDEIWPVKDLKKFVHNKLDNV